jgi:lauroyl/myristoyl acyltransferase
VIRCRSGGGPKIAGLSLSLVNSLEKRKRRMLRRALQPLAYLAGKARAAQMLLELRLAISRNVDPKTQFAILWKFGMNCRWFFQLRQYYSNLFIIPWETFLFARVLEIVRKEHPSYRPKVKLIGGELIEELIKTREKVVLVTIHSFVGLIILQVLKELGVEVTLVAFGRPQMELLGGYQIDFILPSKYVLLKARQKLREGKWISCSADYPPDKSAEFMIGTAIFDFARKLEAKVIFSVTQVSKEGEICIALSRMKHSMSSTESAKEFISFLNSVLTVKKNWKVYTADDRALRLSKLIRGHARKVS